MFIAGVDPTTWRSGGARYGLGSWSINISLLPEQRSLTNRRTGTCESSSLSKYTKRSRPSGSLEDLAEDVTRGPNHNFEPTSCSGPTP